MGTAAKFLKPLPLPPLHWLVVATTATSVSFSKLRNRYPHGSLEGVGGLKTNEVYHSKADALVIPEMYFFENLLTPFFGNVCFVKFGTFSALLALPVMIREGYGRYMKRIYGI